MLIPQMPQMIITSSTDNVWLLYCSKNIDQVEQCERRMRLEFSISHTVLLFISQPLSSLYSIEQYTVLYLNPNATQRITIIGLRIGCPVLSPLLVTSGDRAEFKCHM